MSGLNLSNVLILSNMVMQILKTRTSKPSISYITYQYVFFTTLYKIRSSGTRRQRANGNVLTIKFLDSRLCDVIKKLYVRDIKTNLNKVKEKLCIILKST